MSKNHGTDAEEYAKDIQACFVAVYVRDLMLNELNFSDPEKIKERQALFKELMGSEFTQHSCSLEEFVSLWLFYEAALCISSLLKGNRNKGLILAAASLLQGLFKKYITGQGSSSDTRIRTLLVENIVDIKPRTRKRRGVVVIFPKSLNTSQEQECVRRCTEIQGALKELIEGDSKDPKYEELIQEIRDDQPLFLEMRQQTEKSPEHYPLFELLCRANIKIKTLKFW